MIPVVFLVDLEPDGLGEHVTDGVSWDGVGAVHRFLDERRDAILAATGHPPEFAWMARLDPQVEEVNGSATHVIEAHPAVFADLAARGEPVGLHVHAWRRRDGRWIDDFGDPAWLAECIDRSCDAYESAFGRACRTTRMGGRYLDDRCARHLAARGVVVDLSLEAANHPLPSGSRPTISGDLPDCRRTPRRPHQVAPGLVELPLSATSRIKGRRLRPHLARLRHYGWGGRLDLPMQFARKVRPGDSFRSMLERTLRGQRRPYLALAVRCDDLLEGDKRERVVAQFDDLVAVAAEHGGAFVGPERAVALLGR